MKKQFLTLAMLASMVANATVTVTPISTDYSAKKVTFKVAWTGTPYNNRVWVWVDLCPVTGTSPGTFAPAIINNPSATAGSIATVADNTRGFYVMTSPSTVTATLSNATGQFNWCAYGSDYPPNVLANTNGSYTLAGTPPFTLIASNGTTMQTVNGTTIATAAVTMTPATITDATGYPGLWCPYTGNDLYMDTTHRCRQRQSGAKNWEAWIKDSRDNQIYRITQFSDDNWWFADNLSIDDKVYATCNNTKMYQGSNPPNCPTGWQIPTTSEYVARWQNSIALLNDAFGGSYIGEEIYVGNRCCGYNAPYYRCETSTSLGDSGVRILIVRDNKSTYDCFDWGWTYTCDIPDCENEHSAHIRCFRQL